MCTVIYMLHLIYNIHLWYERRLYICWLQWKAVVNCSNNNNYLLLMRDKLACQYDQMRLKVMSFTIWNLYSSKLFTILQLSISFWRGEYWSTQRKTTQRRVENQRTLPTYDAESENWTWDALMEGECTHRCTNTALLNTYATQYLCHCTNPAPLSSVGQNCLLSQVI